MHRTTPAIGLADIGSVGGVSWEGTPFLSGSEKATWENVRRRTGVRHIQAGANVDIGPLTGSVE